MERKNSYIQKGGDYGMNESDVSPKIGSISERFFAAIIDMFVIMIIATAIGLLIGWIIDTLLPFSTSYAEFRVAMRTVFKSLWVIIPTLYNIVMLSFYQSTVGKKVMRLKVVSEKYGRINLFTILIRETVGKYISTAVFALGLLWILIDKNRQGWHDKIAKTLVIKTK